MKVKLYSIVSLIWVVILLNSSNASFANSKSTTEVSHDNSIIFIENVGQFDEYTRFQVWGARGTIWLAEDGLRITVSKPGENKRLDALSLAIDDHLSNVDQRQQVALRLSFVGANPHPRLSPFKRLSTKVSYFAGHDSNKWRTDVPVWGGVRYIDLYPGVDLEITSENSQIIQRLVAKPGADLQQMRLRVDGVSTIALENDRLRLTTPVGVVYLPLLQIVADGASLTNIREEPRVKNNEISFPFAVSKSTRTNVQSATLNAAGTSDLLYSTFLGGSNMDTASDIAVDATGAAYVVGSTWSADFPTISGSYDATYNGGTTFEPGDVFVAKLKADGSGLVYATYLGGSFSEVGYGIAIDGSGNAYVTGVTSSTDFPTTAGAYDTSFNGHFRNAFVAKLNPTGNVLVYSTFLGGGSHPQLNGTEDIGHDIAVDMTGNAYITGWTQSENFPTTPGAFQTDFGGGHGDAFVTKLNPNGSALVYSSYLGGDSPLNFNIGDIGYGIAVDLEGNAYVTGVSVSGNFPTTSGAYRPTGSSAFLTKVNSAGTDLVYSTFFCDCVAWGYSVAVDSTQHAYITGLAEDANFPTTPGAFQSTHNGGNQDAFVAKMNPAGNNLVFATYLGGNQNDSGSSIVVNTDGNAYVSGWTWSANFPTTAGAYQTSFGSGPEATFVTKLNAAGSGLRYSTFLGSTDFSTGRGQYASSIAVDSAGNTYIGGTTTSPNFPITSGAFQTTHAGSEDAYVAKLAVSDETGSTPSYSISGQVTDANANAIAGVVVSAGPNHNAVTDVDGFYTISGLTPGIYTLTGSKMGYAFFHKKDVDGITINSLLTVTVPPSGDEQDLTGIPCVGPTDLDICQLQKGDILLQDASTQQQALAGFIGTYWFHSAIYDGEGNVLEAAGRFPDDPTKDVRVWPIEDTGFYQNAGDIVVLRPKPQHQSKVDGAIAWAKQKAADPDVMFVPWGFRDLHQFLGVKNQDKLFYCAVFVWRAYKEQGLDLDVDTFLLTVLVPLANTLLGQVLPDDLYASSMSFPWPPGLPFTEVAWDKNPGFFRTLYILLSPADLRVTDSDGNVTGIEPVTRSIINNIPGAFYSGPDSEPEWISVPNIRGVSNVEIHGTGAGAYTFGVRVYHNQTETSDVFCQ